MHVAYQDCQHSHNYYQNFLLYQLAGDRGKSYTGSQIPQCTLLTSSAQPVAPNTACASSAALKAGCPPRPLLSPYSSQDASPVGQWTQVITMEYKHFKACLSLNILLNTCPEAEVIKSCCH